MEEIRTKDFFDMILPGNIKFFFDHYIIGDSYRSVWVIREYLPSTEEQAILSQLADRNGVTGQCWPAVPTIAREIKLSEATVRRAIRDLRKAGLVETEQRYRTKGGKSSLLFRMKDR